MKTINFLLFALLVIPKAKAQTSNLSFYNQVNAEKNYLLPIDKASVIGTHPLGVSEQKTVHIIFPSEVKEIDVGNPHVIVQLTEAFNNVVRVKANARQKFAETNVTVITKDGRLYSFLTNYEQEPEILNVSMGHNYSSDERISKELGINYSNHKVLDESNESFVELKDLAQRAINRKHYIHNVGVYTMKVTALLRGIYAKGDNLYYVVNIINRSEIDYKIDFAKVFVADISEIKRVAVQEEEIPVKYYLPITKEVKSSTEKEFVFVVPFRAVSESKQVDFEIYEDRGARHLKMTIDNKIIQKARQL
ncbi:conjugative transposon protein TraN [Runella limosa]|uniref:conjugative transposon protein TraN n=1 Tax=Runella limosa TaxID=370978 RepID=UPI000688E269|nr:conjugative transposon protein TraN [Runella limosa]